MNIENLLNDLEASLQEDNSDHRTWNLTYFNVHRNRYRNDLKIFQEHFTEGRVLEVGSAPYHVTYLLSQFPCEVVGVDIDPERHRTYIDKHHLNIASCNIETEQLPFPDNYFHYVLLNEVFEHLRINPIQTLREINRVVHPNGKLILTTPNLYAIQNIINFFLGKGFDNPFAEFGKLESLGHMGHVREYSVPQVKTFLAGTGFQSLAVQRNSYRPLPGILRPFNLVRAVFPRYHTFQMHICKKV
ncbi:MAG: methyltransferase domain-containing protein [Bacteroidetes bacterium]|nr:methyltransferase domain-containing protein [Bacteroidota bacterium]